VESGYKRYGGLVSCLILLILAVVTWASASHEPGRTIVMTNAGTTSRDALTVDPTVPTTVPTTLPSTTTTVVVTTTTSPATTTVPSTRPVAPAVGTRPPPPHYSGHNWDAVADCESGGDWHINTGNGFYGGLQFTISSWRGVGGSGMPHQNSREEQIYRGELLLASQGRGAWPVCGRYL
jgi:hypothetical protein